MTARSPLKAQAAALALLFFTALGPGAFAQDKASKRVAEADVVYRNGFVYTVNAVRSRAQAFAVRDGKFLAVGSNDDMKAVTGKNTCPSQSSTDS